MYSQSSPLISYLLHLADTNLILAQRNGEWCAHGPVLEQDIAITNITLDLIGQSRNFYQYAAELINNENPGVHVTEDSLAYLRTEREFKNLLITELPNGNWGQTILRQFLFSNWQYFLFTQLSENSDSQLAAIAVKSFKEVAYHVKWSSEWVVRLGDGTEVSHNKMIKAVDQLWMYTGEFFLPADYESVANVNLQLLKDNWTDKVNEIFTEATLTVPTTTFMQSGGKVGKHTEHLGFLLAELQYLQRTYPGAEW